MLQSQVSPQRRCLSCIHLLAHEKLQQKPSLWDAFVAALSPVSQIWFGIVWHHNAARCCINQLSDSDLPYGISQACCSCRGDEFIGLKFPYKLGRKGSGPWDTRTDALSWSHIGEWSECDREDWGGLSCKISGLLTVHSSEERGVGD